MACARPKLKRTFAVAGHARAWLATLPRSPHSPALWPTRIPSRTPEEEGLIVRETAILAAPRGHAVGWAARWFGWVPAAMPRPAVAVAYLALMAVGGFMIGSHTFLKTNDSAWYDSIRGSATPVSVALDTAEQDTISDLHEPNPVVAASFHKNLALVDNYIQLCEKSVREEPQNELARDYLYDAYHQKADLLDQISERGDESR